MSFSIDTNILLYAINQDSEFHIQAKRFVEKMAKSSETWFFPWPVIHAFLRISTHPGILPHPLSPSQAVSVIEQFMDMTQIHFVSETESFWEQYKREILAGHFRGAAISDVLLVALLKENDVSTLYTADRDFMKFKGMRVINPLS